MEMKSVLSSSFRPCYHYSTLSRSKHVSFQHQRCGFTISASSWSTSSSSVVVVDNLDCLPKDPNTPWLKLHPEMDTFGGILECFYSPVLNQVVRLNRHHCLRVPDTAICFSAANDCLAFVDPKDDCPIFLTNLFNISKDHIRPPSLATMPTVWDVERDPETGKMLKFKMPDITALLHDSNMDPHSMKDHLALATMISHLTFTDLDDEYIFAALQGEIKRLAFSFSGTDLEWIELQEDFHPGVNQNQLHYSWIKDAFYTINAEGILVYDLSHYRKKRSKLVIQFQNRDIEDELKKEREKLRVLKWFISDNSSWEMKYLVGLENGDLLLIIRLGMANEDDLDDVLTHHFEIFRVNFSLRTLERLTTLGDRCIFIGCNQSFSLFASEYPGLKPNCIYFTNHYNHCLDVEDCGIFDMSDGAIHSVSYPYTPNVPLVTDRGWNEVFWVAPAYPGNLC